MYSLIERLGLRDAVDTVVLSTDSGFRKPAPAMFATVNQALGVDAHKTMFVGDKHYEDIQGARTAGMITVRTRTYRDDMVLDTDADAVVDTLAQVPALLGVY